MSNHKDDFILTNKQDEVKDYVFMHGNKTSIRSNKMKQKFNDKSMIPSRHSRVVCPYCDGCDNVYLEWDGNYKGDYLGPIQADIFYNGGLRFRCDNCDNGWNLLVNSHKGECTFYIQHRCINCGKDDDSFNV